VSILSKCLPVKKNLKEIYGMSGKREKILLPEKRRQQDPSPWPRLKTEWGLSERRKKLLTGGAASSSVS